MKLPALLRLYLLLIPSPLTFAASCLYATPVDAAHGLYHDYRDFYRQSGPHLRHVLTDRFFKRIDDAVRCQHAGHCKLDRDPWLNTAGSRIVAEPRFAMVDQGPHRAVVRISLLSARGTQLRIRDILIAARRPAERTCWFVDDFYIQPELPLSLQYATLAAQGG